MITKAEKVFLDKTVDEWINILENVGVPVGRLNFPEEAANDPQILENGLMVNMEHSVAGPYRTVGPIIRMSETPVEASRPSPALGEHTDEVLLELGYSMEAIQHLKTERITY